MAFLLLSAHTLGEQFAPFLMGLWTALARLNSTRARASRVLSLRLYRRVISFSQASISKNEHAERLGMRTTNGSSQQDLQHRHDQARCLSNLATAAAITSAKTFVTFIGTPQAYGGRGNLVPLDERNTDDVVFGAGPEGGSCARVDPSMKMNIGLPKQWLTSLMVSMLEWKSIGGYTPLNALRTWGGLQPASRMTSLACSCPLRHL